MRWKRGRNSKLRSPNFREGLGFTAEALVLPTLAEVKRQASRRSLTCKHLLAYPCSMDAVFKALADPTRRQLLDRLYANNGQTLSELCEPFHMSRQAVTQHIALLEAAKLVLIGWRGREKLHFLNPLPIYEIFKRWAKKYDPSRLEQSAQLIKIVEENNERPMSKGQNV